MNYIEEFCDSIAILNDGRIVLAGDLNEIKRNYPRNRLVVRSAHREQIRRALGARCADGENGSLVITLDAPDQKQSMMQMLTEDFELDEIRVFEPSLNDIFVEYAGAQV